MASRWRKLRAAALILRLLRSRHSVGPSTTRKVALSSDAFPFEPNACCAQSKEELLRRIIAKPIYCQSEVDIKLLAEMLGRCSFNYGLSSASTDALARALHFRVVHDGGILFRQGDAIDETTERFLVVHGSLLVFSNKQAAGNGSQTSRDNTLNRFGECVETCNPGSICGKDAVAGAIVRKTTAMAQTTTLVSFVTKADYLRIARFNVESEAKVLGGVRLLFKKTTASIAPHDLGPEKLLDRKSARLVKRFLHRYECFRTLPHEFLLRLAENLQFHTFNAGETLYPAKDNVPKMFFILSGECCVHLLETTEEGHLKSSAGRKNNSRGFNNVESRPKTNSFDITPGGCICCSETHSQVPGVVPTTHICTLVSGDAFGEMYLSGPAVRFNRVSADGVFFSIPRSSSDPCYVVSVSINEFFAVRSCYLDSIDLEASQAYSILSSKPRDRTCEQLGYLAEYLTSQLSTKLLFGQFPQAIIREICLHATLDTYATNRKVLTCIQEQGKELMNFRIVLDGRLVILKTRDCGDTHIAQVEPNKTADASTCTGQSSNTELLGFDSSSPNLQTNVSDNFVEPVGVLCHGNAFGLLPLLLNSTSAFSYIAYDAPHSGGATVNILSFPGSLTKLYFSTIDNYLMLCPVRALRYVFRSVRATPHPQLPDLRKRQAMNEFERLIFHCPAISGIPRPKLRAMIDRMLVVSVPAHYFLFEAGEYTKGCVFIILEGSVRSVRCPITYNNRETKISIRSKGGPKDVPRLVKQVTEDFISEEEANGPEHALFTFTKPVDDEFWGREYKYLNALGEGDCFGRHGALDVSQPGAQSTSIRNSGKLSLLVRKATSRRFQTGNQAPVHCVYPETAITTSNCRLGILWGDRAVESGFALDPERKMELLTRMEIGADCEVNNHYGHRKSNEEEMNASVLNTCCHSIERMGLAKGLKTSQAVKAATALKYVEIKTGDTVYRQGEEGTALYFILSGRVRLSNGQERTATTANTTSSSEANDFWSIDLCEGDIFGEDFFLDGIASSTRRLTTAVAVVGADNSEPVRLVYLLLNDYVSVSSPWEYFTQKNSLHSIHKAKDLACYRRSTIDRWKAAVFQITRVRSPWTSMLQDNFYLRSQLTLIMIHLLPLFKDIPRQQCLEMCKYCSVEVMPLDSSVFERGDEVLDHFFLIISGSVTMQQLLSPSLQASATTGLDSRARVSVRVLKCGDSFGEVELMLNTSKRLIDAVVSSNRTKLHRVPKYLFCRVWPVQEDLESKLMTIKRAFDAASPLEPEQLCSIYYSAINCSFTRNEVVLGANTQRGTLLVIESGFCVVHDYITLQRKRPRKPAQRDSFQSRTPAPKLALDTRVASLGPSSILLAEFDLTTDTPTNLPDGEYIVAESPIVNAFTVELYPKASEAPATAPSRRHDLLIATLLGRGGLQTVRAAIATQHDRRTESAGVLMRLAEATVPKEKFAEVFSPSVSPLKRNMDTTNMTSDGKTPMQMELHHYLRDRQLPRNPRQPRSTKKSICLVTVGPTALPTKSLGISTGSFAIPTIDGRAKGLFPVLRPVGRCPDVGQHETQSYLDPAVVAASMRSTQLIKESRVIAELSHHSQEILGPRLNTAMEKRQRHGRPPSRQLESRDRLIDVLTPDTNFDNDRRRTEFCRRLLHLKSSDGHK